MVHVSNATRVPFQVLATIERSEDMLDAQFSSLWVYPEKEIDKLVESLDAKDEIYIRILTYALKDEYVSFRTFSQGTWNIKF